MISTLLALSLGFAAQISAQTVSHSEDLSDQIIIGTSGDPATCNSSTARSISLAEAAQKKGVSQGDCVAVTAYWVGRALFTSAADANAKKSMTADTLAGRRVGIYADERTFQIAPHRPQPFKIIGSYSSCETEWPGAMMVLGYCHLSDGAFLKVAQVIPAKRGDVRQPRHCGRSAASHQMPKADMAFVGYASER